MPIPAQVLSMLAAERGTPRKFRNAQGVVGTEPYDSFDATYPRAVQGPKGNYLIPDSPGYAEALIYSDYNKNPFMTAMKESFTSAYDGPFQLSPEERELMELRRRLEMAQKRFKADPNDMGRQDIIDMPARGSSPVAGR